MSAEMQFGPASNATPLTEGGWHGRALCAVEVAYRLHLPIALRATLAHAAFSIASPTNTVALAATAGASLDRREFELGFGAGAMTFNRNKTTKFILEPIFRLGALDGLSLIGTIQIITTTSVGEPPFGGAFGVVTFPLRRGYWLLVRGGWSSDGFARADFALRMLMHGNGGRGSVFMSYSFGAALTFLDPSAETILGPMTGMGVELRL